MNWYSGGKERKKQALIYIAEIMSDLNHETDEPLIQVLKIFSDQLEKNQESVPFTLSQMNLKISECLMKNNLSLSDVNKKRLKDLSSLSEIRYGY